MTTDAFTRLARAAGRGDGAALEAFVTSSFDQVWRFCASLVGRQAADDAAQETFARAVRALPTYRGESSARTWLFAIARHVCFDEVRWVARRGPWAELSQAERLAGPGDASQGAEVGDLLARLDPDRRIAFALTRVVGLSYREAAVVCDCAVGTIRSRVARARRDLMELLDLRAASEGTPASGAG